MAPTGWWGMFGGCHRRSHFPLLENGYIPVISSGGGPTPRVSPHNIQCRHPVAGELAAALQARS